METLPSPEQVARYLRLHPDFFTRNAELFETMTPPELRHGGNVVDIQKHILENLQKSIKTLKSRYDGLITSSRDNMSTLHQVHEAALALMRARGLEEMLEVIAVDLPALFNVDSVRLGIESAAANFYKSKLASEDASGVSFLLPGSVDQALGGDEEVALIEDAEKTQPPEFDAIFADCASLVQSAALLRLLLPSSQRALVLAFGVRIKGYFYEGQGTELLSFLARIIEHRLDECLIESGLAEVL